MDNQTKRTTSGRAAHTSLGAAATASASGAAPAAQSRFSTAEEALNEQRPACTAPAAAGSVKSRLAITPGRSRPGQRGQDHKTGAVDDRV